MSIRIGRRTALMLAALPLTLVAGASETRGIAAAPAPTTPAHAAAEDVPALAAEPALPRAARAGARTAARTAPRQQARLNRLFQRPYRAFTRQQGRRPWWNRPSGAHGADWVYPYFPAACYQADARAGGTAASAWQVLWVYPDNRPNRLATRLRTVRLSVRGAQSVYAASAGRYLRNQGDLFARSLAPRFVTTARCQPDVRPVKVPASVYDTGRVWPGSSSPTPFGPGTVTDWLLAHGYDRPNRKYLVILQSSPSYAPGWAGISEDLAAGAGSGDGRGDETPTLDNPANYTSFSYVDSSWVFLGGRDVADTVYPAQLIAHEMTHSLGAMTASAPHDSSVNPLHPTDCWDLLCYDNQTAGQTYSNGCGTKATASDLARSHLRLDCNRDDYWAPATDAGAPAAAWTRQRWAVSSSSFLYGNPQPTAAQLAAHQR